MQLPVAMIGKFLTQLGYLMVRVVVAARTNRGSARLPVIVSDGLNGYSLSGDGRRPPCHQTLLAADNQLLLHYCLLGSSCSFRNFSSAALAESAISSHFDWAAISNAGIATRAGSPISPSASAEYHAVSR